MVVNSTVFLACTTLIGGPVPCQGTQRSEATRQGEGPQKLNVARSIYQQQKMEGAKQEAPNMAGSGMVLQMRQESRDPEEDGDEDREYPAIGFYAQSGGTTWFDIMFAQGAGPELWERLVDACRTEKMVQMDWGVTNGEAHISTSERLVTFTVARIGEGGGEMTTSFAKEACVDAFEKAATASASQAPCRPTSARVRDLRVTKIIVEAVPQ